MILFVLGCLLSQAAQTSPAPARPAAAQTVQSSVDLLKVKRIFVDNFGDDPASKEMQSMIVSALVASKRFVVTENRARADAILKGVALEKTSQEIHAYGDATAVGSARCGVSTSGGGFAAHHAAIQDSSVNSETIDRSRVSVRLVNADGDVIWTTTQ